MAMDPAKEVLIGLQTPTQYGTLVKCSLLTSKHPKHAHVVWRRLENIAGIMGGDYGAKSQTQGGNTPSIIYAGRCYDSKTRVYAGETQSVWTCTDLRTGKVYWERTDVSAPSYIEYQEGSESVPGAEASVGVTVSLLRIGGNRLQKFNPGNRRYDFRPRNSMHLGPLNTIETVTF